MAAGIKIMITKVIVEILIMVVTKEIWGTELPLAADMKIMDPIEIITTGEIIQKVSSAGTPGSTEDVTWGTVMRDLRVTMTGELHGMDRVIAIILTTVANAVRMTDLATNTTGLTTKAGTIIVEAEIMDRIIIETVVNVDGGTRPLTK